ncbi:type II toxin-antitoxin system HicB family antitoxin [Faecalicatena sp. AGMB00832]|uniref:Type II toxin-antitoxin system HicB family antitoxin n=1 Tax=Faecalicatena faecalis TaxID=2726362 RepID=A0ABS6D8C7_9FIRM|nr:type II toxin-antitoxin system HicB family antitoxin [Faecalicatena faecalis]MBU3877867.1 type II toxin-antitoxin system HicB family antitoxin [Faecalicatena faecalis]
MKDAYPVFICKSDEDYLVYIPDMDIYTEGTSMVDAIEMARDAIGLKGVAFENDHLPIPQPSNFNTALAKAKLEADEDFNYLSGILTLVDVDFTEYRKRMNHRAVKKNCTIPYWLCVEAEKEGINFECVKKSL